MTVKQTTREPALSRGALRQNHWEFVARGLLAFLLGCGRIFSTFSPFGAAFAAAAPAGTAAAVTALGAAAGYLLSADLLWALKYISVIVLSRTAIRVLRDTELADSVLFPPITAMASMAAVGFVWAAETGWEAIPTVTYVAETFIGAGCVFFFNVALSPWNEDREGTGGRLSHWISTTILYGAALTGLCRLDLFGVLVVGRAVAAATVMTVAFKGGMGTGCAFGAALGTAMDLASGTPPLFTASYALAALISAVFAKNGRLLFSLGFIAVNTIIISWTWSRFYMLEPLYEVFAASVTFLVLPDRALRRLSVIFPAHQSGYGFLRAREYTRNRVALAGDAFASLFDAVKTCAGSEAMASDPAVIFDRAAEQVCRSCPNSVRCWQREYSDTVDIMNNATPRLLREGSIQVSDLPERFTDSCRRLPNLVTAINAETRSFLLRRQYRSRLRENLSAACRQYDDTADMLHSLSRELGEEIRVETGLERRLVKHLRSLNIDGTAAVFRVRGGRLRAEIRAEQLKKLTKEEGWLERLSELMGTRLCAASDGPEGDKLVLLEAEPLTITVGSASAVKGGGKVSGDAGSCFRTDEGSLCVLLSDGMGSGDLAAAVSSKLVGSMELFLKAGVAPELALRLLADLTFLKNEESTETAALDLLTVDMFSGETRIYKYGSAPTYLKRGEQVKRVESRGFPVGLIRPGRERVPGAKTRLTSGAFAVLVSDGVLTGSQDRWLRELIAAYGGTDPKELAGAIIERAMQQTGCGDDMTALVLLAEDRG